MTSTMWVVRLARLGFVRGPWMVAAAVVSLLLSGCAAGMGGMMAGGGMHRGEGYDAEVRVDERLYAPDRLLARADALRLTAEQVVALQRLRDAVRDDGLNAQVAARSAYDLLTASQRQTAERRDRPSAPAAPSHRHD
jgi:hypothetical protein